MNSNGFGIGLGVGMLLGYRSGFLARPYSNTHGYNTYEDIHRREKYNRRKDGLLECAVANTTVYVKKLINIQGKINLQVERYLLSPSVFNLNALREVYFVFLKCTIMRCVY